MPSTELSTNKEISHFEISQLTISEDMKGFLRDHQAIVVELHKPVYKAKVIVEEDDQDYDDEEEEKEKPLKVVIFKHSQELPVALPNGYGFMGGVARNVVLSELGEEPMHFRDIDVVGIKDYEPDLKIRQSLSDEIMPDDTKYGYDIEIHSLKNYLESRDFVLNELLVHGDDVIMTPQALEDLHNKTVRPTDFELARGYNDTGRYAISPKLTMKALRMQSEMEYQYEQGTLQSIEEWQFDSGEIPMIWLAVNINKAFARNDVLAFMFYQKLLEHGTVSRRDDDPYAKYSANSPGELAISIRATWQIKDPQRNPFTFARDELNTTKTPEEYAYAHRGNSDIDDYEYYSNIARAYYNKIHGVPKTDSRFEGKTRTEMFTKEKREQPDWSALKEQQDEDKVDQTAVAKALSKAVMGKDSPLVEKITSVLDAHDKEIQSREVTPIDWASLEDDDDLYELLLSESSLLKIIRKD